MFSIIYEWQNHRINGKGFWDHWVQPMTEYHRVTETMALSSTSTLLFNISKDDDSTTSLGITLQYLTTLGENSFTNLQPKLPLALETTSLVLLLVACEKSPPLRGLPAPFRQLWRGIRSPPVLSLQSKQPQFPQPPL